MSAMFSWLTKAQSLFSPSASPCLTCGKRISGSSPFPGVCRICAESIPWIRSPRCLKCGRHVGCPDCTRSTEPSPIICNRSAVAYNSVMREWLGQYKYSGNERYALLLGLMLDRAYLTLKKEKQSTLLSREPSIIHRSWSADLLVPVPVSDSRLMERGFNQAERLADVLSRRRKVQQLPLLIRTHHTGKQSFKSRAERLADMKHAFAENPAVTTQFADLMKREVPLNRPVRIVIVDDIYTTGSTIRACAEIIQQIGSDYGYTIEVYSLTWARS
ncbi:ComF family protein [Paenibacillus sp. VTT E-133280]|uniref:ComF family protein n=1 Tax=Paenibacillus sp. VTT E-133280 TaxID=1986222 RepID=UPI00211AB3A8|nr:ComF family protein [Paenibacillus sp. VTT E-133280]